MPASFARSALIPLLTLFVAIGDTEAQQGSYLAVQIPSDIEYVGFSSSGDLFGSRIVSGSIRQPLEISVTDGATAATYNSLRRGMLPLAGTPSLMAGQYFSNSLPYLFLKSSNGSTLIDPLNSIGLPFVEDVEFAVVGGSSSGHMIADIDIPESNNPSMPAARIGIITDPNGLVVPLAIPGAEIQMRDVNNSGVALGYAVSSHGGPRPNIAFISDPANPGALTHLSLTGLEGYQDVETDAINDLNVVVGHVSHPPTLITWSSLSTAPIVINLTSQGYFLAHGADINSAGDIVGNGDLPGLLSEPFLIRNGSFVKISSLLSQQSSLQLIHAQKLSERGAILGYCRDSAGATLRCVVRPL